MIQNKEKENNDLNVKKVDILPMSKDRGLYQEKNKSIKIEQGTINLISSIADFEEVLNILKSNININSALKYPQGDINYLISLKRLQSCKSSNFDIGIF